ncbi:nucleoside recognition domain-containing protein [Paracoccus xiamenensis]|uniref:nucleoside recognition domain-containing protein n=1 Tax=Paracoccus xiamenensis TaxID=2714901 RepID=UPI00140E2337|nr:nucleoside recognition domain-containing protein [Paracoccus xiamenensis]NHF71748.1 nucleoside recognition protein [Paracoccus xiamenensis]
MAHPILDKTRQTLVIYWELARIIIPVTIATEILSRLGLIEAVAPALAPLMALFGLPPELGLPWLTGMLVGIWAAVPMVFVLLPVGALSTGDITVFSALLLFAHALPIEQKIIQRAGPGFVITTLLRVGGGMLYAFLLHQVLAATGWLSGPMQPAWIPMAAGGGWPGFFIGLAEAMAMMLVILLALSWAMEVLRVTGVMAWLMRLLAPLLRLAGIRGEAAELTSVGLFLGISYGGGLLIREARSGTVSPRQVFISCVFMGFAHSVIEDTAIVMSVGANIWGVLAGRVVFAIAATALIAAILRAVPDDRFLRWWFRPLSR